MTFLFGGSSDTHRTGKQDRINHDRFFSIMNQGWFVHMRHEIEVFQDVENHSGIVGPFETRAAANTYLSEFLAKSNNQPVKDDPEGWRY